MEGHLVSEILASPLTIFFCITPLYASMLRWLSLCLRSSGRSSSEEKDKPESGLRVACSRTMQQSTREHNSSWWVVGRDPFIVRNMCTSIAACRGK